MQACKLETIAVNQIFIGHNLAQNMSEVPKWHNGHTSLEEARICPTCACASPYIEECSHASFEITELKRMRCPNTKCPIKDWFYCVTCSKPLRSKVRAHASTKTHISNRSRLLGSKKNVLCTTTTTTTTTFVTQQDLTPVPPSWGDDEAEVQDADMEVQDADMETLQDLDSSPSQDCGTTQTCGTTTPVVCKFTPINLAGHEWIARANRESPVATQEDMASAFSHQDLEGMQNYFISELASNKNGNFEGFCGGGLLYLLARAFQGCSDDAKIDHNKYPSQEEALWHLRCITQYHQLSEKGRQREIEILRALNPSVCRRHKDDGSLFKHTWMPRPEEVARIYGGATKSAFWNSLPCPRSRLIADGVAYTPPRASIAFCLANGIPIDNFMVTKEEVIMSHDTVHQVSHSRKATLWKQEVQKAYYGATNGGAPKKAPFIVLIALSEWGDGFGPGKVKNNRNSVDLKTFTISPPTNTSNGLLNTFPVAIGLKSSRGWREAERKFQKDLEELTNSKQPIPFYHGATKKIIHCCFKRFGVLADKQERNGITGTLSCSGDNHRCFGVSGKLLTPSCKVEDIKSFFEMQATVGKQPGFGWADTFVHKTVNGHALPACKRCRKENLKKLGLLFRGTNSNRMDNACNNCCNWDLLPSNSTLSCLLRFPAHKDYPTHATQGCPVNPPFGRDQFGQDTSLPWVPITWDSLMSACRFAHWQASVPVPKKHCWNKGEFTAYLKHCGVSTGLTEELHEAAKATGTDQQAVDYSDPTGIGSFKFPAAWTSKEVLLTDFVETVMHQLFLGIAESNFELINKWLKESKIGETPFLKALQTLIKDLRPFQLSWLNAYPLTGSGKSLGTGSWVAENWVFFVRMSPFIYGWCHRDQEKACKSGANDMSRVVIAFHCLVSRILTHGGTTEELLEQIGLYMKEFLSAARELDVRVRHEKLNAPIKNASEKKRTEAWWMKPNYMSLFNILHLISMLGPACEWWDGGFKGEKIIQKVKPHIKRGIRCDSENFFVNLLNKLFRFIQLEIMEKQFGLDKKESDELVSLSQALGDLAASCSVEPESDDGDNNEEEEEVELREGAQPDDIRGPQQRLSQQELMQQLMDDQQTASSLQELNEDKAENEDGELTEKERFGMSKPKVFFVYRSEAQMEIAINDGKPLAGVTVRGTDDVEEFLLVFRRRRRLFSKRVVFADGHGKWFHNLWCAKVSLAGGEDQWEDTEEIQNVASSGVVAIPLSYTLGEGHHDARKYCLLSNWWKTRMSDGTYKHQRLDPSLYGATGTHLGKRRRNQETSNPSTIQRQGLQFADI